MSGNGSISDVLLLGRIILNQALQITGLLYMVKETPGLQPSVFCFISNNIFIKEIFKFFIDKHFINEFENGF